MRHHKLIGIITAAVMLLALIAVPVMAAGEPSAFHGSVTKDGQQCPGSLITVTLEDGTPVATEPTDPIIVDGNSEYAMAALQDYNTQKPETGDTLYFYVDGALAGTSTFVSLGNEELDLVTGVSTFTLTINVNPTGRGTTSPSVGTHSYPAGTDVTITATANPDWDFDEWSGDAHGTSTTTTVTMDSNKTVTANFEPEGEPAATFASWLYETFVECLVD